MSFRYGLLAALSSVLLGSAAATAATINVASYNMNNGNGTVSLGTYNYLDGGYVGASSPANSLTEAAPLFGGKGNLADNVIPTIDYTLAPQQYVGWKYTDPVLHFFLQPGSQLSQITLYFANPIQNPGTLDGGLVGLPGQVNLSIGGSLQSVIPTLSAVSSVVSALTFSFASPLSYTGATDFQFELLRGPLLADSLYYHTLYPGDEAFNINAYNVNKEPWLMLSEVQFTTAVPEPSTWVMMIAGFAALGFAASRRKVAAALT